MYFKVLCLLFSASFLLACTPRYEDKTLLSIPVEGTMPVADESLKSYQDQLGQNSRAKGISFAVFNVWGQKYTTARRVASLIEKSEGSDHSLYHITYIFDGVPDDDSVSGYLYRMLIRDNGEAFEIVELEESWRCWPDRGHQYFDVTPCN